MLDSVAEDEGSWEVDEADVVSELSMLSRLLRAGDGLGGKMMMGIPPSVMVCAVVALALKEKLVLSVDDAPSVMVCAVVALTLEEKLVLFVDDAAVDVAKNIEVVVEFAKTIAVALADTNADDVLGTVINVGVVVTLADPNGDDVLGTVINVGAVVTLADPNGDDNLVTVINVGAVVTLAVVFKAISLVDDVLGNAINVGAVVTFAVVFKTFKSILLVDDILGDVINVGVVVTLAVVLKAILLVDDTFGNTIHFGAVVAFAVVLEAILLLELSEVAVCNAETEALADRLLGETEAMAVLETWAGSVEADRTIQRFSNT